MSFKQQYINEMIKNEPDLLLTLLIGASEELFIDISKYLISSKLQYNSNHISIKNNKVTFNITSSKIKKIKKHINNILIQ
jgi:predicted DNA binding CopG/RHH family protein